MKQVWSVILLPVLMIACTNAAEDFYRDDKGSVYTLGLFGERVYESDDGKPNSKKAHKESFTKQDEFTDFGWGLFQNTNDRTLDNFVISSVSPHILLGLISKASGRETRSEINKAIKTRDFFRIAKVVKALKAEESARKLEIATALFVDNEFDGKIHDEYSTEANSSNIDIYYMNFKNPKSLQTKYDQWINSKTNGALKNQRLTIDPKAKIVLSSAIYFKGDWLFAFKDTKPGLFHMTKDNSVEVDMMSLSYKKFHYGHLSQDLGEWLSIPYNSTDAMLILLPNKTNKFDINEFVKKTPYTDITDIVNIISEHNHPSTLVNITLPKFKLDSAITLTEPLKKMGIQKIFSQDSEFSPLSNGPPLRVSSAIQQTSLEVNQFGSIGASASKFSVVALSVQVPIKEVKFVVDRPFVAVIVNRLYRIPYFIAKVSDPSKV